MTWKSFRSREEVLHDVIAAANDRRDGRLPMDVDGVAEVFEDELALLGALQLRWHTRLSGRIERELMSPPTDPEDAVVAAWRATADELPGVLAIVDRHRAEPADGAMAGAMATSSAKEQILLAMMAGRASAPDASAVRVGAAIEGRARASYRPGATHVRDRAGRQRLLRRLRTALAA